MQRDKRASGTKADGNGRSHKSIKNNKNRSERRKAKRNPDCVPTYGIFRDYES